MTIQEYLKCLVEDAKALNVANKRDIAAALDITPQQLSHLLKGRDDWRAAYIDKLCTVTKQRFVWPRGEYADCDDGVHQMLSDLMSAGKPWSTAARANIEELHNSMIAGRRQSAASKEAAA